MSNMIYEDKMYNEEIKEEFLSYLDNEGYQDNYRRFFKIAYPIESQLKKDLYDFTRDELRGYFYRIMPKTVKASRTIVSHLSNYIDWAIEKGYKRTNLNPLLLTDNEWREQFAQKQLKSYWTDAEIRKIVESRANNQDAIILLLPFNGVYGKGGSEILNLTYRNIDKNNNQLTLHDSDSDNSWRTITVDEDLINACLKAYEETDYEVMNGNPSPDAARKSIDLVDNDYIVRLARTRVNENAKADHNILHRRMRKIADEINEPNFTTKNIVYSGMIAMAKNLYLESGKLEQEEYEKIMKQFNFDTTKLYRYKNDFLNLETIKELYNLA
ncbi:tyrosine-type recombinase/integrase [Paenibacillus naphthalenovorans]|uniref:DNA breaking-rejoining enzyme n=1 Tax=Paenibacillus naphthalenovorans TaxID=162209 RepID=A0A0U2UGA1_9BACL|nr:site-specific integrase [Paenibacillus naphthalenovorans]ALS22204.1 DNA breaking-rejoining enzyme [Paenibacillus naphthalenovorans]